MNTANSRIYSNNVTIEWFKIDVSKNSFNNRSDGERQLVRSVTLVNVTLVYL